MFEVIVFPDAQAFYSGADPSLTRKLDRCFAQLERNPLKHPNIKPLKGKWAGHSRFRVGDYRVVFGIDHSARVVNVLDIAHRREIYD